MTKANYARARRKSKGMLHNVIMLFGTTIALLLMIFWENGTAFRILQQAPRRDLGTGQDLVQLQENRVAKSPSYEGAILSATGTFSQPHQLTSTTTKSVTVTTTPADPCQRSTAPPCDPASSECVSKGEDAVCQCLTGYKPSGNPHNCDDINECVEGVLSDVNKPPCNFTLARCVNQPGGFRCECFPGTENGPGAELVHVTKPCLECCVDIDECARSLFDPRQCDQCIDGLAIPQNYTCECRKNRFNDNPRICEDCEFGPFGSFGECSNGCGPGTISAMRQPIGAGASQLACLESSLRYLNNSCFGVHECGPADCQMSAWSAWSDCTGPTPGQEGTRTRKRVLEDPRKCPDVAAEESQVCRVPDDLGSMLGNMSWPGALAAAAGTAAVLGVIGFIGYRCISRRVRPPTDAWQAANWNSN